MSVIKEKTDQTNHCVKCVQSKQISNIYNNSINGAFLILNKNQVITKIIVDVSKALISLVSKVLALFWRKTKH